MGRRFTRLGGVLIAAIALSACGAASKLPSLPKLLDRSSASDAPQCTLSPLTGLCTDLDAPVLVVKIDDVGQARPQWHLNEADVIVVEPVEGGLTRLFAVYQSQAPETVGPIRSARITDTDLVTAFGRPGFAYSGSNAKLKQYLLDGAMQLVGAPQGASGYTRMTDRPAPHNYAGDFALLVARIKDPVAARLASSQNWTVTANIDDRVTAGKAITAALVSWPASKKTFTWNAEKKWWDISVFADPLQSQLDASGTTERAHATNVAIMETELLPSPYRDKLGSTTPYPNTIGEGRGMVLIDGREVPATWRRAETTAMPRWFLDDGTEIPLAAGNTWWLLVEDLQKVTPTFVGATPKA